MFDKFHLLCVHIRRQLVRKIGLRAIQLKNKLQTTVTKELKIDIYTLALIMFKITNATSIALDKNVVYVKLNKVKKCA